VRALPRDRRREHRMPRARRVTGHANRRLADGAEASTVGKEQPRARRPRRAEAANRREPLADTETRCRLLPARAPRPEPALPLLPAADGRVVGDIGRVEDTPKLPVDVGHGVRRPSRRCHALAERAPASPRRHAPRPLRPSPQTLPSIPRSHVPRRALPVRDPPAPLTRAPLTIASLASAVDARLHAGYAIADCEPPHLVLDRRTARAGVDLPARMGQCVIGRRPGTLRSLRDAPDLQRTLSTADGPGN